MSVDFTTAAGLRMLLTELHYASSDAWRHDPGAAALVRYATDKYASLATKHGLEPDDAAYAAFNVLRTGAVRRAHDPWAVTTRAVQVALIYDERANGLLCSTDQARRAEISAHHDADRFGDHEASLLDYHPAFHVQPEVVDLDQEDPEAPQVTVHDAFEMTVRLFTALGGRQPRPPRHRSAGAHQADQSPTRQHQDITCVIVSPGSRRGRRGIAASAPSYSPGPSSRVGRSTTTRKSSRAT